MDILCSVVQLKTSQIFFWSDFDLHGGLDKFPEESKEYLSVYTLLRLLGPPQIWQIMYGIGFLFGLPVYLETLHGLAFYKGNLS